MTRQRSADLVARSLDLASRLELVRLRARLLALDPDLALAGAHALARISALLTSLGAPDLLRFPDLAEFVVRLRREASRGIELRQLQRVIDTSSLEVATALRSGDAFEGRIKLNRLAELPLPSFDGHLAFDSQLSGLEIHVNVHSGRPSQGRHVDAEWATPGAGRLSASYEGSAVAWAPVAYQTLPVGMSVIPETRLVRDSLDRIPGGHRTAVSTTDVTDDLSAAVDVIDRTGSSYSEGIRALVKWVVPLQSDSVYSSSDFDLPGVVFIRLRRGDPLWNAELLFHEAAHNWLMLLMRLDPLVLPTGDVYKSPWRADRRPMRGIVAGTHAFLLVTRFFAQRWELGLLPLRAGAQRALIEHRRTFLGYRKLERYAKWTPAGRLFFRGLTREFDDVQSHLVRLRSQSTLWRKPPVEHDWPTRVDDD